MAFNQLLWIIHGKVLNRVSEEDSLKKYEDLAPGGIFPKSTKVYIEKIEAILSEYNSLQEFVDSSTGWITPDSVKGKASSLYLEAFCNGVSSEIQSLNHVFKDVEESMLNDSSISMLEILNKFEYVVNVLSSLNLAVRKVRDSKNYSCAILNLCDNLICSGSSLNAMVLRRVQKYCLKQFYKQTKLWVNEAVLYDPFNEFFICQAEDSQTTFDSTISMSTVRTVASIASSSTSRYKVNPENLPGIIPCSVALKMLFIGEALTICQHNEGGSKTNDQILSACGISKQSIASQLNEIEKKDYFSLREFSSLIDQLWVGVNKYIWQICDEIGNARDQLVLMREIYLLGRGELFQEFLLKGSSLLGRDVTSANSNDLNRVFKDAIYYVYLTETSELTDQFFFKLPSKNKALMQGFTVWSVMQLECKLKWPLQCLFTTDIMKIYNKVFCFLLKLKKAHIDINSTSTWKSVNCIKDRKLMMELIEVRMCLRAVVGNFQNYCFTNVIANEMTLFMESLKNIVMFTDLQKSLFIVLNNIKSRLFIPEVYSSDRTCDKSINSYTKVHKWFKTIFTLCKSFSELFENEDHLALQKIIDIKNELQIVLKKLFSLLQDIDDNYYYEDCNSTTHLYSLLMCLDYTGFFRNKFHLNKSD